jgi:hypothetical protein
MAHAVISLDQFTKAFSALDVGAHGSVALRDLDLGLIARHPEPVSAGTAIGQKFVSPEFMAFAQSGGSIGTYRAITPFDHIQRTFAEFTHGICPDCAKEVFPRSSGKHTAL